MDLNAQCVVLVLSEMGLSFLGIVCNLLVVTTLRHDESLRGTSLNFLLLNLCFSNLLVSFLVKPISAIYVGYAISTGTWHVGLAFCTLYTFTYRTTWCVLPFTLFAMSWCKLLAQCRCPFLRRSKRSKKTRDSPETQVKSVTTARPPAQEQQQPAPLTELASYFSNGSGSNRREHGNGHTLVGRQHSSGNMLQSLNTFDSASTPTPSETCGGDQEKQQSAAAATVEVAETQREEVVQSGNPEQDREKQQPAKSRRRTVEDGPTARQQLMICLIWLLAAFFGVTTCFPDKVFGVAMSRQILEDQLRTIPPSPSVGTPRDVDLTYCTVRTGMNDLLDYLSVAVSLVLPLILGPVAAIVLQVTTHLLCQTTGAFARKLARKNWNFFFQERTK